MDTGSEEVYVTLSCIPVTVPTTIFIEFASFIILCILFLLNLD